MKNWDWTRPMKCETCGKEIYSIPETWAYKRLIRKKRGADPTLFVFCSWHCMRKWEKEVEDENQT